MTRPDRSDETAFAAAIRTAHDRAQTEARRQSSLSQHEGYDRDAWLRHYRWWIDEDGVTIRSGRAFTRRAATRRKHRAYLRELNHDHRARPAAER
jgi:hypothetical protein